MKILSNFPISFRQFLLEGEVAETDGKMPRGTKTHLFLLPVTHEEKKWVEETLLHMKIGQSFCYGGRRGEITDPENFLIRIAAPDSPSFQDAPERYFLLKASDPASHRHLLALRSRFYLGNAPTFVQAVNLDVEGKTKMLLLECEES